jgi:hypothetical protein
MEINWDVQLWPRQKQAFDSPATEILFGGASEGGKSHFVREALIVWSLWISGLQSAIFRKHFDDVIGNHMYGPSGFRARLAPLAQQGIVELTQTEVRFKNGSLISLEHCLDERALDKHQGREKHVVAWDEATQIPEKCLRFIRGWVRMSEDMRATLPIELKDKFPKILYTANPIGVSVGFFRRHFVKARPEFAIEKVDGFLRQYIPSRVEDNLSVDREAHIGRLQGLGDAALIDALDRGNWDAPVGDFYPEWDDARHIISDFVPPAHWFRFRSFDWGTAEPFVVYWWAVSDGESFKDHSGSARWYPRGCLIAYREWNGCNPDKPAEGLRYRNEDIAMGIVARSLASEEKGLSTITDSLPFQDRGGKTIAETFMECGVPLTLGDTSRVTGWSQLRSRLIGKEIDSNDKVRHPMILFVESCQAARDYMPALPRHPSEKKMEDAAEHGEATHSPDAIRLACMARPLVVDADPPPFDSRDIKMNITFEQAFKRHQHLKRRVASGKY